MCLLHSLWYRLVCLFGSHLKWLSWGIAVTISSVGFHEWCDSVTALLWFVVTLHSSTVYSISSRISGSFSLARSRCDDLVVIVMGKGYASFFPLHELLYCAFWLSVTTQLLLWRNKIFVVCSFSRNCWIEHSVTIHDSHLHVHSRVSWGGRWIQWIEG